MAHWQAVARRSAMGAQAGASRACGAAAAMPSLAPFAELPSPPTSWLGDHTLAFFGGMKRGLEADKPWQFVRDWHDEYGPMVYTKSLALGKAILVGDPRLVKELIKADPQSLTKGKSYDIVKRGFLDDTLVVSEGEVWQRKRALYRTAMRLGAVNSYTPLFAAVAREVAEDWMAKHQHQETVDAVHTFGHAALEAIGKAGFGVDGLSKPNPFLAAFESYMDAIEREAKSPASLLPMNLRRVYHRWQGGPKHMAAICEESIRIVNNAAMKEAGEQTHRNLVALMQEAMKEEGYELDADQLAREANLFIFAGRDTTGNTLAWLWAKLGAHPEIQERIYEEVSPAASSDEELIARLHEAGSFPHLTAAIRETLRTNPPAPTVIRETAKEMEVGGYIIPEGVNFLPSIWAIHHDASVFPDPYEWRPSRWLEGSAEEKKRMTEHWMPFFVGARNCIGQHFAMTEMRVLTALLLRRFRAELVSKPHTTMAFLLQARNVVLRCTPR